MASVLQVISAIERIANAAATSPASSPTASASRASWWPTCPRPRRWRTGSSSGRARTWPTGHSPRWSCRWPRACGSWPSVGGGTGSSTRSRATRSSNPATSSSCEGSPAGITRLRELAGASAVGAAGRPTDGVAHRPRPGGRHARRDEEHLRGRGGPRLLGAGAPRPEPGRRGPPPRGPPRRDEGPARGLGPAGRRRGHRPLAAAGPAAPVPGGRGHRRPGPADGVAHRAGRGHPPHPRHRPSARATRSCVRIPWRPGSDADGATLGELQLNIEPGLPGPGHQAGRPLPLPAPRATSSSRPATSSSSAAPTRAGPCWPARLGWRFTLDEETGELRPRPPRPRPPDPRWGHGRGTATFAADGRSLPADGSRPSRRRGLEGRAAPWPGTTPRACGPCWSPAPAARRATS